MKKTNKSIKDFKKMSIVRIIVLFIAIVQIFLIYYGGSLFRTIGLSLKEFEIMILLASTVIPIDFIRKIFLKKKNIVRKI